MSLSPTSAINSPDTRSIAFNAALDAHLAREAQIRSSKKIASEVRHEAITSILRLCAVPIAWLAAYGATELFYPHDETTKPGNNPQEEIRQRFDENKNGKLDPNEITTARRFYSQRLEFIDSIKE